MIRQTVTIRGKRFVMVEETKLRQLEALARKAEGQSPPLPPADAKGNRPALRVHPGLDRPGHYQGAAGPRAQPGSVGRVSRAPTGNSLSPRIRKAFADGADRRKDRPSAEALLPRDEQPTASEEEQVAQGDSALRA